MCGRLLTAFFLLTLALLARESHAKACSRRSTVVQVKIPKRTNVTVNYPPQVQPVSFVPYPDASGSNVPTCYTCQNGVCQKCDNSATKPNNPTAPAMRTNIIIEINGKQPNGSASNATDPNSDMIVIQSNATATSNSKAASDGNGSTAATSAATTVTDTDVIATINDPTKDGTPTETVLVDADSESKSKSTAKATSGNQKDSTPAPAPAATAAQSGAAAVSAAQ